MREGEPRGVQELALEPEAARRAVLGVADDRDARSPAGARGSGACGRSPGARAAASCAAAPRSISKCVTASRGIVGVGRHPRAHAAVAAERRVDRPGARRRPALDEREVLARDLARAAAPPSARGGPPRSSRRRAARTCRGPGGARSRPAPRPPRRPRRALSAWASVPGRVPARRVHDDAGGLVDDEQVLVLVGERERRVGADRGRRRLARARRPRRARPALSRWRLGAAPRRRRARAPASIRRCARAREPSGAARNASRRSPGVLRRRSPAPSAGRSGDEEQHEHADGDRHVGDVERRPRRQLDEVGHRAVADAVDDVAERAAEQQAGRQPDAAAGRGA